MEGSGLYGWLAGWSGISTQPPSGVSTTVESGKTYSVGGAVFSSSSSSSSSSFVVCVSGGGEAVTRSSHVMLMLMRQCLAVSPLWCRHLPGLFSYVCVMAPPPPPPLRTPYAVHVGRCLSIEQKPLVTFCIFVRVALYICVSFGYTLSNQLCQMVSHTACSHRLR